MGRGWLFAILLSALTIVGASMAVGGDDGPLSPAQIVLFETNHLKSIQEAERLEYRFVREAGSESGGRAAGYSDRVDLDVRPRQDGSKNVWVDFLSGEHHVPFPPLMNFNGNPVLMFFLEHDVEEMNQMTGGAASYFRHRIRQAFVDRADLKINPDRARRRLAPATEITLVPFRDDPHFAVFPGLTEKRYRFVLSEVVPGAIYEIDSVTPGADGKTTRLRETMTFESEQPCPAGDGPCARPAPR